MLKKIKVINHLNESLELELTKPALSGFVVLSVDGLGPAKADVNITEVLSQDGGVFNSSRMQTRNILLQLAMEDITVDVDTLRRRTYKYFPIKRPIQLIFETDTRTCKTTGYVESNDPIIFSKRQATSISILCPSAYFSALEKVTTTFSGAVSLFEFPFSNESLTENLIQFGSLLINTEETVYYTGDGEVGITIYIHFLGTVEDLVIYDITTGQVMSIDTDKIATIMGSGLSNGDDIIISTIKGNKSITLVRNGISTNILNALGTNADWFYLQKGDNLFTYTATTGLSNMQFQVEHQVVYEGV